jgi:hypothetical protein
MEDRIAVELTFKGESEAEVQALLSEAGAENVETRQSRGFTGIEIVMLGLLLADGISKLVERLTRTWKCGVVVTVDSGGKKVTTEKNCDLPRGSVLLVHPDGTQVTLQEPATAEISSWFKDVFKAVAGKA